MPGYTRRRFIGVTSAGVAAALGGASMSAQPRRQPHVLLLMADQFRADCLGAAGHPCVLTPNLDRIARDGILCDRAYSSTPSCTPARSGLLTGLTPWHHGMLGYGQVAVRYENELPQMMREAGYHTLGIGKMHYHPQRNPHGFHQTILDESGRVEAPDFESDYRKWFREAAPGRDPDATAIGWNDHRAAPYALPERLHPTRWTGDRAVEFLEGYEAGQPFFLKVSFARPHSPYDPPRRFFDRYADADIPPAYLGDWAEPNAMRGRESFPDDLARGDLGPEVVRRSRQGYYGSVAFIDDQIGRILDVLRKRGFLDDALILFTSDHGDMTGDHYLWRKTFAYEASARVPMLVRWPEWLVSAERGRRVSELVELRDVLPTCLAAANGSYDPSRFDGRSLLELVTAETSDWRGTLDLEHSTCYWPENQWTGVTDGRFKYVYYAPTGQQQLFDLEADPHEVHDLVLDPESATLVAEWRARMVETLAERGEPYVVDGDLGIRAKGMLYSPNYPDAPE